MTDACGGEPPPERETPDAGGAPGAKGQTLGQDRQEGYRSDWNERKGGSGSFEFDDPDRPQWDRQTELEREYHYHHADGREAYTVLKGRRADGRKVFLQGRRVNGHSEYAEAQREGETYRYPGIDHYRKGTGGEPELLFRLPELLKAMAERPDDPIFICEGEKDVDRLWDAGLLATTNPKGALSWRGEFNATLKGRDLVILTDNDDKGRKRTAKLLPMLDPVAASVKALDLPDLPECGDVSDWLDAGNSAENLVALVAEQSVTDPAEWATEHGEFSTDENGKPHRSQKNARVALRKMGVTVTYDAFARRHLLSGLAGFGPLLDDAALTRMKLRVEEEFNLPFGKERWFEIVTNEARKASFHPVRDYLDTLTWDREPRVQDWLVAYAGAEDSEYVRAVGQLVLVAAVRRVRQPGCKFDEMVVLESKQGTNKSSALAIMAVREEWFADDLPLNADSKVVIEQVSGRWLVELAEMKGMRRGEIESVKSMLSRRVDKARLAYGRMPTEQPRECIFFGTTNDQQYLRDMTGNRRFWPVAIEKFDLKAIRKDRDQLWAEAAHLEAEGASIRLPERLWALAGEQQSAREIADPWFEILALRLEGVTGKLAARQVWEMVGLSDFSRRGQDHNLRLAAVMQALGWERPKGKLRIHGQPQSAYVKGEPQLGGIYPDAEPNAEEM